MTSVQQDKNHFSTFTYLGVSDIIRMPMYFFLVIAFPTRSKTGLHQFLLSKREPWGLLALCWITGIISISLTAVQYITFSLSVVGFS